MIYREKICDLSMCSSFFFFFKAILVPFTVLIPPKEGFCSTYRTKWHCWNSLSLKMFKHSITNRRIDKKRVVVSCVTVSVSGFFDCSFWAQPGCLPQHSGINQLSVLPFISLSSHRREGMGLRVLASDEKLPSSPGHLNKPWPSPTQHPPLSPQICLRFHHPQKTNSHGQTWDNHLFG